MTEKSTTKPSTPRLSVAQLRDIAMPRIEQIEFNFEKLEKQSTRKTSGQGREITRLHAMVKALKTEIERMNPNENNIFTNERNRARLEEIIDGRLIELNNSLNEKFSEIDNRLGDHDAKLVALQAQADGATTVGNVNSAEIRNIKTKITEIGGDSLPRAAVPWAIVSFLGIGFVVGLILWLQPPIVTVDTLSDGITKVPTTWAPLHDIGSWVIGALVGFLAAALILMFAKRRTQSNATVQEASIFVQHDANNPPAGYPGTSTAPTKVMQTTGAGSGAQ